MADERDEIDVDELFRDGTAIDAALKRGVRQALRRHKLLGQDIVVWEDGKVVIVPPEEIPDFDEENPGAPGEGD